jgi:hypothetical protein
MMNYLQELNAFRDWTLLNHPSTGQIALWYSLMSIDNMTGWQEWFTVANQTLQLMTGMSKAGLDKARGELINKGLIQYKAGSTKQAGRYRLVSIYSKKVDQWENNERTMSRPIGEQSENNEKTINKLNNTKQNEKDNKPPISPFENYTQNADLLQRLRDFLEMRKAIKKPMTDRAKSELLTKLDKLASTDEEKIAILDQSIFNSWQGVFALKQDNRAGSVTRTSTADQNKQLLEEYFHGKAGSGETA